MTKEEIVQGLYRGDSKAIKKAIKALEQQPSEDAISRQAVNEYLEKLLDGRFDDFMSAVIIGIKDNINALPPVTPTFPKGTTNGDILKIVFPNIEADEIKTNTGGYIEVKYLDTTDKCDATAFRKNWWNTPYERM